MKSRYNFIKHLIRTTRVKYDYYMRLSGYRSFPSIIYVNINNVCNLKCKMCDVGQRVETSSFYKNLKTEDQLSIEEWKQFIDNVASFKPIIHINGTEPLLYKHLFEFIKYVRDKNMYCKITTNGVLLPKFAKQLIEADIQLINVSIDGPPKIHDLIRGVPGTFDKAYTGIKQIGTFKKEYNISNPDIIIVFTISNYNYEHLVDTIAAFDGLDITRIHFGALSFKTKKMVERHNRLCKIYPATVESLADVNPAEIDTKKLMTEIKKVKSMYNSDMVRFNPDLNLQELEIYYKKPEQFLDSMSSRCLIPWYSSQINSNGDIIPTDRCLHTVLGNIREKSFKEIWNDEPYREFRKSLKKVKRYPICARCGGIF